MEVRVGASRGAGADQGREKVTSRSVGAPAHLNFPSKLTHPLERQSMGMEHISTEESGSSRGRKERVCAQMGVSRMAGTDGCTIDPPAARE